MTRLGRNLNQSPKTLSQRRHLSVDFCQRGHWAQGSKFERLRWHYAYDQCPLLALSGHLYRLPECPLSGVKRTSSALGVGQLQQPNVRAADMDPRELLAVTDLSRASVYRALDR